MWVLFKYLKNKVKHWFLCKLSSQECQPEMVYCRWLITVGSQLIKCSINLHKNTNPELTGSYSKAQITTVGVDMIS